MVNNTTEKAQQTWQTALSDARGMGMTLAVRTDAEAGIAKGVSAVRKHRSALLSAFDQEMYDTVEAEEVKVDAEVAYSDMIMLNAGAELMRKVLLTISLTFGRPSFAVASSDGGDRMRETE